MKKKKIKSKSLEFLDGGLVLNKEVYCPHCKEFFSYVHTHLFGIT